ncbi:MAG: hypothetical protein Alpg2KO_21760 [Alphaproteobacteria bacterium]
MSKAPKQSESDFDRLMQAARPAQRKLNKLLRAAATRYNGIGVYPGAKSTQRAAEKVIEDYAGDASRLIDLARGSIVVMSLEEVDEVRDFFSRHGRIVREKDRFAKPLKHGHRDLTLNVELDCGHICEVQIHLLEMFAFKSETHALYKKLRRIEENTAGLPAEERQEQAGVLTQRIQQMNIEAVRLFNQRTTGRKLQPQHPQPPKADRRTRIMLGGTYRNIRTVSLQPTKRKARRSLPRL